MILKIVLNLYVTVEMVLKQLISSFDTSLALMFKDKPSSTIYFVISKTKVQISFTKCNIGSGHCSFKREI